MNSEEAFMKSMLIALAILSSVTEAKRAGRAVTMDLVGSRTETGLEVKSVLLH